MKYIILVIGIVLSLCVSGCINLEVSGVYELDGATMALRDDNTYLYVPDSGISQKGTFEIYDNNLELTNVLGMTTILTITEDGLVDDKGKLWRKI